MSKTRTHQEIQSEYAQACAQLGDLVFKMEGAEVTISNLKLQLRKLDIEATQAVKAMQQMPPTTGPVAVSTEQGQHLA